tara:strand:+ start:53 stop:622 length:570 start_codon:yes stop_codon:yes gene_type:complete
MRNYLILDIETNGVGTFRPPRQRPIQVSFQLIDGKGNILKDYSEFIKGVNLIRWGGSIGECPWSVEFVNNNGVSLGKCLKEIKKCINEDTIIVGHNIEFDVGTLMNSRHSKTIASTPTICTMKSSVEFCKIKKSGYATKYNGYKWPKLSELSQVLEIPTTLENFHDSKYDVEITKKCFLKLIKNQVLKG